MDELKREEDTEKKPTEKKPTFEQSLARLEQLVKKLEEGDVSLEDSLLMFEEGVKLVKLLNELLDRAEQKVTILMKNAAGMEEKPFGSDK